MIVNAARETQSTRPTKFGSLITARWFGLGATAIFLLHTVISYWAVIRDRYPIAPGDDIRVHLEYARILQHQAQFWIFGQYPPGLHWLLISLARLTGANLATVSSYVWPLLLIFSALAILWLATVVFGRKVGLLAYGLFALVALQPLQTANDGGLPNILAANIILPIALAALILLFRTKGWPKRFGLGLVVIIAGALILVTHHLSTIIFGAVIITSLLVYFGLTLFQERRRPRPVEMLGLAVGGLVFGLVWFSPIAQSARELATSALHGNASSGLGFSAYSLVINGLVFQLGLVGFFYGLYQLYCRRNFGLVVVTCWFGLYFLTSRSTRIIEPERLVRDLAMPAAILAAATFYQLRDYLKGFRALQLFYTFLLVVILLFGLSTKTKSQLRYNPMVRFSTADQQLLEYIQSNPTLGPIQVEVKNPFWALMAADQVQSGQVILSPDPLQEALPTDGRCFAAGYYQAQVWPPQLSDRTALAFVLAMPGYRVRLKLADPNKVWYLLCKP